MIKQSGEIGKTIMRLDIIQEAGDELIKKIELRHNNGRDEVSDREQEEEEAVMSKYGLVELITIVLRTLIAIEEEEEEHEGEEKEEEEEDGRIESRNENKWREIVDIEGISFGVQRVEERTTEIMGRLKGKRKDRMRNVQISCRTLKGLITDIQLLREKKRGEEEREADDDRESGRMRYSRIQTVQIIEELTKEKEEVVRRNTELGREKEEVIRRNIELTREKEELIRRNIELTREKEELKRENDGLKSETENSISSIRNVLHTVVKIPDKQVTIREENRFYNCMSSCQTIIVGYKMTTVWLCLLLLRTVHTL